MKWFIGSLIVVLTSLFLGSAVLAEPANTTPNPTPAVTKSCINASALSQYPEFRDLLVALVNGLLEDSPCESQRIVVTKAEPLPPTDSNFWSLEMVLDGKTETIQAKTAEGIQAKAIVLIAAAMSHPPPTPPVAMKVIQGAFQDGGANGFLRVNSQPWSNVWIDGKDTGLITPVVKYKITAGPHTVTLKNLRFQCEGTYDVNVAPDQTAVLNKRLDCRT